MLLTKAAIQSLQTTFSLIYHLAFGASPEWSSKISMTVPSATRTNTYGWMKKLPKMRKWLGPRQIQNLDTDSYMLENEPYELTVGVDRDDIKDDMLGVYNPLFASMGESAKKWPDQVVRTVLQVNGNGFDGVAFFATTHPLNPAGNQSNVFATTALTAANFAIVRAAMMSYTGGDGEPLGVNPNTIFVPPQLADTANTIVTAEFGASGATNIQKGQAQVVVVPELANQPTVWYLADCSGAIKPIVWQLREPPNFVAKTEPTDDNVFFLRQFIWGVDARGAAGYGPWFLIARGTA